MKSKKKQDQERKVERAIHQRLQELQLFLGMYMGEHQIERGDAIPHEELWVKIRKRFQFKLTDAEKYDIRQAIRANIQGVNDKERIVQIISGYVFGMLEKRDEVFKRKIKHPKMYPSPYPNHL